MSTVRTIYQKYVFGLSFPLGHAVQGQDFLLETHIHTITPVTLLGNTQKEGKKVLKWL